MLAGVFKQNDEVMIKYSHTTRAGKGKENEDCFRTVSSDGVAVFVLADGMGGRSHGAEAACIVTETMCEYPWNKEDVFHCIEESLCCADKALKQRSEVLNCKMGCAVGCLAITEKGLFYAGMGDVRLYVKDFTGEYRQFSIDDVLIGRDGQTFLTRSIRGRGVRLPVRTLFIKSDCISKICLCTDGYYRNDERDDATVVDITLM